MRLAPQVLRSIFMKKIIISISLVAVLLLAACSTDHDNGNDEARKNSSHHEISKNKSGENQKPAKTDTSVKVQIPKMEFPFKKDKDIPIEFTVTKDGKPYRNAVLALQVDLGPVGVPFNAKEVGKGHYKSSVHVIKPGTYQARVIEKKGEDIKSLSSFQLRFKQ